LGSYTKYITSIVSYDNWVDDNGFAVTANDLDSFNNDGEWVYANNIQGNDTEQIEAIIGYPGDVFYMNNADIDVRARGKRSNTTNSNSEIWISYKKPGGNNINISKDIGDSTSWTTYSFSDGIPDVDIDQMTNVRVYISAYGEGSIFNVDLYVSALDFVWHNYTSVAEASPDGFYTNAGDPDENGAFRLYWDYNSHQSEYDHYDIYANYNGSGYEVVATQTNKYTEYKDLTNQPAGAHFYTTWAVSAQSSGFDAGNNSNNVLVWIVYPPTNIAWDATDDDDGILKGTWTAATYAPTKYQVRLYTEYGDTKITGNWTTLDNDEVDYDYNSLINDREYRIGVRAYWYTGHYSYGDTKYTAEQISSIGYVHNLQVCTSPTWTSTDVYIDAGELKANWLLPSQPQDNIDVFLYSGVTQIDSANKEISDETHTFTNLSNQIDYYFKVQSTEESRTVLTDASSAVRVTVSELPTALYWDDTERDLGKLTANWTNPTQVQDTYSIYLNSAGVDGTPIEIPVDSTSYTFEGLDNKINYKFKITANVGNNTDTTAYSEINEVALGWQGTICTVKNPNNVLHVDERDIEGHVCEVIDDDDVN